MNGHVQEIIVTVEDKPRERDRRIAVMTFRYQDRNDKTCTGVIAGQGRDITEMVIDFGNNVRIRSGVLEIVMRELLHRILRAGGGANDEKRPQQEAILNNNTTNLAAPETIQETNTEFPPITEKMGQQELVEMAIAEQADLPAIKSNTSKTVIREAIEENRKRLTAEKAKAASQGEREPF